MKETMQDFLKKRLSKEMDATTAGSRAQWCVPVKLRLVGKIFKRLENVIALGQPVARTNFSFERYRLPT